MISYIPNLINISVTTRLILHIQPIIRSVTMSTITHGISTHGYNPEKLTFQIVQTLTSVCIYINI